MEVTFPTWPSKEWVWPWTDRSVLYTLIRGLPATANHRLSGETRRRLIGCRYAASQWVGRRWLGARGPTESGYWMVLQHIPLCTSQNLLKKWRQGKGVGQCIQG